MLGPMRENWLEQIGTFTSTIQKSGEKGRNSDTLEVFHHIAARRRSRETVVTSGDYFHHEMKPFLSSQFEVAVHYYYY